MARQLIILDRDGTLIRHVPYLCLPAQVSLLPGVRDGLARLREAGCLLFLHTNQSGVGRGYFPLEAALACNDEMLRQLGLGSDLFESTCVCPEAPDSPAVYRKPSPRFGLELLERFGQPPNTACYVGDNLSDLMTAAELGYRGIGVNTGVHDLRQAQSEGVLDTRFAVCDSFSEVVERLLAEQETGHG